MTNCNLIIFPFIFFFLNISLHLSVSDVQTDSANVNHHIYFIKQRWHTAIVINIKEINSELFREFDSFKDYNLIDIGWGDEKFYQIPRFDSGLAYQALFYKTPSTIRVEGIDITKDEYFDLSEIVVELVVTDDQFIKICNFINQSFKLDSEDKAQILSKRAGGKIIFYKANESYHIFNTCNTWLARGLNQAGIEIEENIILTEQLFNGLSKIGTVIKADY
jgi:uncharacterized protein (TIGR02117 family)